MAAATAAPPATGSEPPSQKSFCTSTTISARCPFCRTFSGMGGVLRVVADRGHVGGDGRVPAAELSSCGGGLGEGGHVPGRRVVQTLPSDDLTCGDQPSQQLSVVTVVQRLEADPDDL